MQQQRMKIGLAAEKFALDWEKERLAGAGMEHRIVEIDDRRDRPGFGHDFRSFERQGGYRYIEVKTVAKTNGGHRFFLSENEHSVSRSTSHEQGYYFYLVFIGGNGLPAELRAVKATKLYPQAQLSASSYQVIFDREFLI